MAKSDKNSTTQGYTSLPPEVAPYYNDVWQRSAYETSLPYQKYEGQRLADFSPQQQEAMARMSELGMSGTSQSLTEAAKLASKVGQQGIGSISYGGSANYRPGAMGDAGAYTADSRQSGYTPGARDSGYGINSRQSGYNADSRQSGYGAGSRQSGYGAGRIDQNSYQGGQRNMGFRPGTLNDSAMLQSYMSPYQQSVTNINKREAMRDADIRQRDTGLGAASAGSLGGYREGIIRSETERDLGQRLDDLQTQGQQDAFSNAQQMFEQDRSARGQAEQFGQSQFNINEQIQQRQSQLMQQGFNANEAARQAQEQFGQSQYGMNEQNRQAQEQFGQNQFGMNEQNRQAQEQFGQNQYGMNEQTRRSVEQFMQSQFGMNQQAAQQAEQYLQSQFGMNSQNQQYGAQAGLNRYNAQENANQAAQGFRLQAADSRMRAQSANVNAQLGLQQNQLNASSQLGQYGQQEQDMAMSRLGMLQGVGNQQQQQAQAGLDIGYNDFQDQRDWGKEQVSFQNNILNSNPMAPGTTSTTQGQQVSPLSQALGAGIAGYGASGKGGTQP